MNLPDDRRIDLPTLERMVRISLILFVIAALLLSGCAALVLPVAGSDTALTPAPGLVTAPTPLPGPDTDPNPVEVGSGYVTDTPDQYTDLETFRNALLQALAAGDTDKLGKMMTEPFLAGTWRAGQWQMTPAQALEELYGAQLEKQRALNVVQGVDLNALLGGTDPLTIASSGAGAIDEVLVSGWGKGGQDEAVLFISRLADGSLKWHGWMAVKGGFSGARLGGIKPFINQFQGYSLYVPQNFGISLEGSNSVDLIAPVAGRPAEPAMAFIFVEPANGRTTGQVVEAAIAELGAGDFQISIDPVLRIEGVEAFVVNGLPGQDVNRQLFMVHNDQLYRIMFMPTNSNSPAYPQVENIYAMVVNTWHFTK